MWRDQNLVSLLSQQEEPPSAGYRNLRKTMNNKLWNGTNLTVKRYGKTKVPTARWEIFYVLNTTNINCSDEVQVYNSIIAPLKREYLGARNNASKVLFNVTISRSVLCFHSLFLFVRFTCLSTLISVDYDSIFELNTAISFQFDLYFISI